jgi:hypothetical protein
MGVGLRGFVRVNIGGPRYTRKPKKKRRTVAPLPPVGRQSPESRHRIFTHIGYPQIRI